MSKLTERQAEVLAFIKSFIIDNGWPPTRTEIGANFGMYPSGADCHLMALEKKGAIEMKKATQRGIRVVKGFRVRVKS